MSCLEVSDDSCGISCPTLLSQQHSGCCLRPQSGPAGDLQTGCSGCLVVGSAPAKISLLTAGCFASFSGKLPVFLLDSVLAGLQLLLWFCFGSASLLAAGSSCDCFWLPTLSRCRSITVEACLGWCAWYAHTGVHGPEPDNPGPPLTGIQPPGTGLHPTPRRPPPNAAVSPPSRCCGSGCLKPIPKAELLRFSIILARSLCLCALKRASGASRKGWDCLKASV